MGLLDSIFGSGSNVSMPKPKEYMPLIQQQADINRLDTKTPFGGVRYNAPDPLSFEEWSKDKGPAAMSFDDWWGKNNPANNSYEYGGLANNAPTAFDRAGYDAYVANLGGPSQEAYNQYVQDFKMANQPTVESYMSPELSGIFSKIFDENAYSNYADDYMAETRRRLDPIFDRQTERFEQNMFNRGQPVGGELYDDTFKNMMQSQNDAYTSAAFQAQGQADNARLRDFNTLMAAMSGNQVPYAPIDTMGPVNMAMNTNMANAQADAQASSNMWNTLGTLGTAGLMYGLAPGPGVWGKPAF